MTGFTFNGVHSSTFGLYYIPDANDMWFSDPEYDVHDIDISWRNGGYYFDSKVKNRTFTIKCFFEEIDLATRQRIKQWVKRGTRGILVFDDMPFVYWNVVPGKIPVGNWYLDTGETHSGTVTITFTAYEPFGYLTRKSNGNHNYNDNSEAYCRFIDAADMPAAPTTSSTSFEIYNPGTEECGLSIDIAGTTSNPIRFYNVANGTYCEFTALPSSKHIHIDGDTGYVYTYTAGTTAYTNGFGYHGRGVVSVLPNEGFSGIQYTYGGINGTTYTIIPVGISVSNDMVGGKLKIENLANTEFTVISISRATNKLYCSRTGSGTPPASGICSLTRTNHIQIQEKVNNAWIEPTTLTLSAIEVDYNPRIS